MIKNFILKKGDELSFKITFVNEVTIDSMEFGVKTDYTDEEFVILKTIGNGITKLDSKNYQVTVASSEMETLDILSYVYDIRIRSGSMIRTPLSGKVIIKETVFNG